ncbi:MAG: glycosyltransferase family 4 protein [Chitinophagaceae bacterium]
MVKIVSIVWYKVLPPLFGGQKGIANFNNHLAKHYPLVCLCSANNETTSDTLYKVLPELPLGKSQFFNPFCWKKIKAVVKEEKATHIILEHPYHAIAAYKAKKASSAKLILHSHNIESERFRLNGKWGWRLLRRCEKWIFRKSDLIIFKTGSDRDFAIKYFKTDSGKCIVVPYGIERISLSGKSEAKNIIRKRHNIGEDEKIFLFAGTLDYEPNAEAVKKIYSEIASRLSKGDYPFKIIICGRNKFASFQCLKELIHPHVINAGEVTDIENYFAAADAFINTVQQGGGIQTKNIDALASNCNVVCFENMVEEETVNLVGNKIFTVQAKDWQGFVGRMKEAANQLAETPPSFFEYYKWENIMSGIVAKLNTI